MKKIILLLLSTIIISAAEKKEGVANSIAYVAGSTSAAIVYTGVAIITSPLHLFGFYNAPKEDKKDVMPPQEETQKGEGR